MLPLCCYEKHYLLCQNTGQLQQNSFSKLTKLFPDSPLNQKRKCLYDNRKMKRNTHKWQLHCPSLNRRATARQGVLRAILRRKRCGAAVLFSRYIHKHHGYKLTTTSAEQCWQRHIGVPGWMLCGGVEMRWSYTQ